jgi:hypothetical protein
MGKQVDFETSGELKKLFNQELDAWCGRTRLGLEELSARCGVSRSYIAHIGRYGRIPSKPVLLLLALNFGMKDPSALLRAARVQDPWPFDHPARVDTLESTANGFLSVKLDMDGLVGALKDAIREQFRPRTLKDLLGDRPLRIGLNHTQPWLYETLPDGSTDFTRGFVPDLIDLLGHSLRYPIASVPVPFNRHVEKLRNGEIDIFGPMVSTPQGPAKALFSLPVSRMGMSAVWRLRSTTSLADLPPPQTFEELRNPEYQIAVHKDSRGQLITNTRLGRPDDSLILCETVEEGLDRVRLRGVSKPAHILICASMTTLWAIRDHPDELMPLFNTRTSLIDICDNAFAIRSDWPEAVAPINQALSFIMSSGGFGARVNELVRKNSGGLFDIQDYATSQIQAVMGMAS